MKYEQHVVSVVQDAVEEEIPEDTLRDALEEPPSLEMGDIALVCYPLASELRTAPEEIASSLATSTSPDQVIQEVSAEGAYVNFTLKRPVVIRQTIERIVEQGGDYGRQEIGAGKTIVLDYSAPNIAKPFHLGHLRSTNIGEDLARIFEFLGYDVWRKNYLGDWGTQFGFVIYGWKEYGSETKLEEDSIEHLVDLYVRANQEAEHDPSVRDKAREYFRRLEEGDPEMRELWKRFRQLSIQKFRETYDRLGIEFDSYEGEAAAQERVDEVIERFKEAGIAEKSEGALIVEVEEDEVPPCMLHKSDGATTYAARDVAEAIRRWEKHRFAHNMYVVGRQEDHFAQVFGALEKLAEAEDWDVRWPDRCENISFGFVQGMSTREGNAIWLEDVLDEAKERARESRKEKQQANPEAYPPLTEEELDRNSEAIGQAALLFTDVSARRIRQIQFDWDEVLQFEGRTGPYLQYTFARVEGVLREAEEREKGIPSEVDYRQIGNDLEWKLVRQLRQFPQALRRAGEEREPNVVAMYLFDLASCFNSFYGACQIVDEGAPELTSARLALVRAVKIVLKNGLRLLRIRPLEVM